jgi:hypothetical protein
MVAGSSGTARVRPPWGVRASGRGRIGLLALHRGCGAAAQRWDASVSVSNLLGDAGVVGADTG